MSLNKLSSQIPTLSSGKNSTDQDSNSAVSRRVFVEGLNDNLCTQAIIDDLTEQSGILDIRIDPQRSCIYVRYNNTVIGIDTVVSILKSKGYSLQQHFWDRLKYNWWCYLDENTRNNATYDASGSCCSNPTKVFAQRRHR